MTLCFFPLSLSLCSMAIKLILLSEFRTDMCAMHRTFFFRLLLHLMWYERTPKYTGSWQSGKKNKTGKEVFAESRCLRESITCENGSLIRYYESTSQVNRSNVMIVVIKLTAVEMPFCEHFSSISFAKWKLISFNCCSI